MIRITVACPESMMYNANQLAMCLARTKADEGTYDRAVWTDNDKNLYSVASFVVPPEWITKAQSPIVRPLWDTDEYINMTAANLAHNALVFHDAGMDPNIPLANTTTLLAIGRMVGLEAVAAMGLHDYSPDMDELNPDDDLPELDGNIIE